MTCEYKHEDEILAVVKGFEDCTTGKDSFSHRSHLTVGVVYLQSLPLEQAFEKMRAGLLRFLKHHEVDASVYSDDITRRWMEEIQNVISEKNATASLVEITNAVIERLSDKELGRGDKGNGETSK